MSYHTYLLSNMKVDKYGSEVLFLYFQLMCSYKWAFRYCMTVIEETFYEVSKNCKSFLVLYGHFDRITTEHVTIRYNETFACCFVRRCWVF